MGVAGDALGQQDADQDRRDLEDRHEQRHVALEEDLPRCQIGDHHGEGTCAHRAVVRRHAGGVDAVEAQAAQQGEGQQWQGDAQAQHQPRLAEQRQAGLLGQLHAAVQADGQQQEDGQGFVERGRQLQFAFQQACGQAEDEEQHHRVEAHPSLLGQFGYL
ncbi:hypothetical protein D3C85_1193750 [compost metagenome]